MPVDTFARTLAPELPAIGPAASGSSGVPGAQSAIQWQVGTFQYHNDEDRTLSTRHPDHDLWTTVGDIGYIDDDGYLYLTDRKAFMIISGGVNIYPQEVENVLALHPAVADAAVIGVPDSEMGEQVKAVVQLEPGHTGSAAPHSSLTRCRVIFFTSASFN